eukprot:scaffold128539_cov31-Tisochrysis_lutea.AAC.2
MTAPHDESKGVEGVGAAPNKGPPSRALSRWTGRSERAVGHRRAARRTLSADNRRWATRQRRVEWWGNWSRSGPASCSMAPGNTSDWPAAGNALTGGVPSVPIGRNIAASAVMCGRIAPGRGPQDGAMFGKRVGWRALGVCSRVLRGPLCEWARYACAPSLCAGAYPKTQPPAKGPAAPCPEQLAWYPPGVGQVQPLPPPTNGFTAGLGGELKQPVPKGCGAAKGAVGGWHGGGGNGGGGG